MIGKSAAALAAASFTAVLGMSGQAAAGQMRAGLDYGGYVNIIVREVKVSPVRAHVGDVVTVEIVVEDQGDPYYANIPAEILANGRTVARRLVTYGLGGEGSRVQRLSLQWDTRGAKAGEYRIEGQVFVWNDASPFDNSLKVPEPVVLLAPGAPLPEGRDGGGAAVARDPRYKPAGAVSGTPLPGGY